MTVGELKRELEDADDDVEVRLAFQPHWPFEYSVSTAAVTELDLAIVQNIDDEEAAVGWHVVDENEDPQDNEHWVSGPYEAWGAASVELNRLVSEHKPVFYLAEGTQLGYLPGTARGAIGWK